jgi:RNA polymerase sigma factor (sigma-70 family)
VLNEKDIVQGCQRNNASAQQALVMQYAPMLLSAAMRYVRQRSDAEDVLQNALMQILDAMPKFKYGEGSFEGWMRRIVVNTALKSLRKPSSLSIEPMEDHHPEQEIAPDVYQKLALDELLALVNELPDGCREVFNLFVMEEYSHKEIGELLNINESTSRSQLTRARSLLRKKLEFSETNNIKIAV